jgi:hypothetical protein
MKSPSTALRVTMLLFSLLFSLSFYGQNDTISAGKTAKIALVAAERMNVVYRGMANPISIYVPNNTQFMASAPGLSKDSKGKYSLTPGPESEVIVNVVYQKGGSYVSEKHKFKIVDKPLLNIGINDDPSYALCSSCIYEVPKEALKNAGFTAIINRAFLYDSDLKILGMGFTFSNDKYIRISGSKMNEEAFAAIDGLKKGETFTITFSLNNSDMPANPLKIMIKE